MSGVRIFNAKWVGHTYRPYDVSSGFAIDKVKANELIVMPDPMVKPPEIKPGQISAHKVIHRVNEKLYLDVGVWVIALDYQQAQEPYGSLFLSFRSAEQKKKFLDTLADAVETIDNECLRPTGTEESIFLTVHPKGPHQLRL